MRTYNYTTRNDDVCGKLILVSREDFDLLLRFNWNSDVTPGKYKFCFAASYLGELIMAAAHRATGDLKNSLMKLLREIQRMKLSVEPNVQGYVRIGVPNVYVYTSIPCLFVLYCINRQ